MPNLDAISFLSPSAIGSAIEVTVASIASPTELNSRAAAQGDLILARTIEAGTGTQTLYYADATTDAESLPYIVSSATAGVKFVAVAGRYVNQAVGINGALTLVVPLASTSGGTGVNNAGTITNASNTTITGGGTVALGGFTLTVPATGTAGLLGTAQTWTALNTFSSASGLSITGAGGLNVTTGTAYIVGAGAGVVIEAGSNARALSTYVNVNAAAGNNRAFTFQTGGNFRWLVTCNGTAESGGNAGSDFAWNAYDDAGGFIDTPLFIARAGGGAITMARPFALSTASSGLIISKTTGTTLTVSSTDTTASAVLNGGLTIATGKNVRHGTAAIATNATDGFIYAPTCAGTPTGTPTTLTGTAPIVIDTTNHKLFFYSGGAWRDAGP
jgi:hypothetical protein